MAIPNQAAPAAAPVSAPPQSNDEAISGFARGFLGELDQNEDPNQHGHDVEADTESAPPETESLETPEPEAETPTPEPEVPLVDVDVDGETFKIPEKVKHRVMADKDYRQKTMEVAATRKTLETLTATAQKINEQAQQMAPYHAQLFQMENQAQYLNHRLQSDQALQQDPTEWNRVQGQLAILLHQKGEFAQGLQQQKARLDFEFQRLRAEKLSVDAPKLFQEFPDLAKPESRTKLAAYVEEQGLPPEAMDFLSYSAAGTKLAWKAHQYDVMVKEQAQVKAKLKSSEKATPAATPSSRAAESGAKDKQALNAWKKGGGKFTDPNFDAALRARLRGK